MQRIFGSDFCGHSERMGGEHLLSSLKKSLLLTVNNCWALYKRAYLILHSDRQQMPLQLNDVRLQQYGLELLRIGDTDPRAAAGRTDHTVQPPQRCLRRRWRGMHGCAGWRLCGRRKHVAGIDGRPLLMMLMLMVRLGLVYVMLLLLVLVLRHIRCRRRLLLHVLDARVQLDLLAERHMQLRLQVALHLQQCLHVVLKSVRLEAIGQRVALHLEQLLQQFVALASQQSNVVARHPVEVLLEEGGWRAGGVRLRVDLLLLPLMGLQAIRLVPQSQALAVYHIEQIPQFVVRIVGHAMRSTSTDVAGVGDAAGGAGWSGRVMMS